MDTRDKRASAVCVGLPFRIFQNPDGAWDKGDRQQSGLSYRGIEATVGATIVGAWSNVIYAFSGGRILARSGGRIEAESGGRLEVTS